MSPPITTKGEHVAKDLKLARQYWQQAATLGDKDAMHGLGRLYQEGWGVDRDPAEAARWYEAAARQGSFDAPLAIGLLYASGRLRNERKEIKALGWYLVWEVFRPNARDMRPELFMGLSPAAQAEAEKWAEAYIKKHLDP